MTLPSPTTLPPMTDQHAQAFQELKQKIEEQFGPVVKGETWYDDVTIDRFLRARSYSIPAALSQFSTTDKWRRDSHLAQRFEDMDGAWLRRARQCYPRLVGRCDRRGRPMFVFQPGAIDPSKHKDLLEASEERRFSTIAVLTEHLTSLYIPMASTLNQQRGGGPVTESMSIVDLSGLSFRTLWTLRSHLGSASKLNSAHFPETLGTLVLVNTPSFFSTIWSWIQAWFDKGTREKIVILSGEEMRAGKFKELVEPEDLPVGYGGELEWTYFDQPDLDEGFKELLGVQEMPDAPCRWNGERLVMAGEAGKKDDAVEMNGGGDEAREPH